jgi:hypothetical protein
MNCNRYITIVVSYLMHCTSGDRKIIDENYGSERIATLAV